MARILSVEIGNSITRISELDFRVKNPKVYKYFCIPTPQGVLEDGFVRENVDFAPTLKRTLSENKIKTKQVVFTVTSSKIVTREVSIPAIKMNQVGSYIRANANDYFPIDLSAYEIAHVVLGVEKGDDGKDKYRVMVMAAGKDLIAGYTKLANNCGLRLMNLDYSGNSIYQIMKNECGDKAKLVVKVEDGSTIASVIANRSMMLQRNINYGFERALQAYMDIADSYTMTQTEAFEAMCKKCYIKAVLSDRTKEVERDEVYNETEIEAENRKKITATFGQLLSNLGRVIELYNSKGPDLPISEVVLVGMGSEIVGLTKLLTNELGVPTKTVKNFGSVSTFQTLDAESMGKYVGVLGAALDPVNLLSEESKKKSGRNVNYGLFTTLVLVAFVIAVIAMLAMALVPYYTAKEVETALKQKEQTYQEAEVVHNQYLAMSDFYNEMKSKYKMTEHSNDELVAFLTEMEEKLPADIKVTEFTSDSEKAVFTIQVKELEEAAKIFQILRGFESLMDVTVSEASEKEEAAAEEGAEAEKWLQFGVECYYYPIATGENAEAVE
ncbi:MAG: pilus assembly protein PilM [Lachnospiraceae bacterium]|nr:pilus assembly protein PilM [Lachnospiraceae bacterium]